MRLIKGSSTEGNRSTVDPFATPTHDLVSVNPYTPKIITFLCRKIGWYSATELVWDCWIYIEPDEMRQ